MVKTYSETAFFAFTLLLILSSYESSSSNNSAAVLIKQGVRFFKGFSVSWVAICKHM